MDIDLQIHAKFFKSLPNTIGFQYNITSLTSSYNWSSYDDI